MQHEATSGQWSDRKKEKVWTQGLDRRMVVSVAAIVVVAVAGYLLTSRQVFAIGFPLDDAWIHQTYARNLAELGEWSFIPGKPSAGSTAPLWSVLLSIGYLLKLQPYLWTFLAGSLSLFGLALAGERLLRAIRPEMKSRLPWAGLFLAGEWHMVWAAASGMETLLSALLILLVLWQVGKARGRGWVWVGMVIGFAIWVRPDTLTLLGPAGFTLLLGEKDWGDRARGAAWLAAGFALLFAPYLLFNLAVQGTPWPNTFYAKQAEYAANQQLSLPLRFFNEIKLPLLGGGLFLLPGFLWITWQALRERRWAVIAGIVWFLGYALLYAMYLPVMYQYGRYFMPAMPVYFVLGIAGVGELMARFRVKRLGRVLTRALAMSAVGVWVGFYVIGAGRYAQDVAIIETEMVATARWVAANTVPGDLIAAHDIGAMGYFARRDLVDLAGLISPEVIPIIRDEAGLADLLDQRRVAYLVTFPGWYTNLLDGKESVFHTGGRFSLLSGGENMQVYRWAPE